MENNLTQTTELTPRQWWLYRTIKELNRKVSIGELSLGWNLVVEEKNMSKKEMFNLHTSEGNKSNCPALYKDINILNESTEIEKIIVVDNGFFYLGTEDESIAYANKLFARAIKSWKKYLAIKQRISADGRGKLLSCQNTIIDENSTARPFVESFRKE